MQYMGGKSRIAKQIASTMLEGTSERSWYVEPFVGAGSVAVQMAPHFEHAYLSDASPDLIALWRALQMGWEPPDMVSEELYEYLRNAAVSPLRGFVGYGCSFGGKWFGGYARHTCGTCQKPGKTFATHSAGSLLKKIERIRSSNFFCLDYQDILIPDGSVVYLDPPYADTTGYSRIGDFDSTALWKWAEELSSRASVFVSEYSAPRGWLPVWDGKPYASLRKANQESHTSEHLWARCRLQGDA